MIEKEICICAAVIADNGQIIRGHRHCDCLTTAKRMKLTCSYSDNKQGFITSKNRYVGRKEGYLLQISANIPSTNNGSYFPDELYSEDLY
jgi:hypothetical protein